MGMLYTSVVGVLLIDEVANQCDIADQMVEEITMLDERCDHLQDYQMMWQDETRDVQGLVVYIGDQVEAMNMDVVEVKERMGYLRDQMDVVMEDIKGVWEWVLALEGHVVSQIQFWTSKIHDNSRNL